MLSILRDLKDLSLVKTFSLNGPVGETLLEPVSVAISPSGCFVVADSQSCYIVIYSSDGKYETHFSTLPKRNFHLYWDLLPYQPASVACLSDERIVYSLPKSESVIVARPDGWIDLCIVGRPLYEPYGLAVNESDQIFIADRFKCRILCYDCNGKLLKLIGGFGSTSGYLQMPYYIAVDIWDNLYVNELQSVSNKQQIVIHKYNNKGVRTETLMPTLLSDNDDSIGPITVDSNGTIYQNEPVSGTVIQIKPCGDDSYKEEPVSAGPLKHITYIAISESTKLVCLSKMDKLIKVFDFDKELLINHRINNAMPFKHKYLSDDSLSDPLVSD